MSRIQETARRIMRDISREVEDLRLGTHEKSKFIEGYDVYYTVYVQQVELPTHGSYDYPPFGGSVEVYLEKIECDDDFMTSELEQYIGKL